MFLFFEFSFSSIVCPAKAKESNQFSWSILGMSCKPLPVRNKKKNNDIALWEKQIVWLLYLKKRPNSCKPFDVTWQNVPSRKRDILPIYYLYFYPCWI